MCRAASARRSPGSPAQRLTGKQKAGRFSVAVAATTKAVGSAGSAKAVAAAPKTIAVAGNGADEQLEGASRALHS